MKTIINKLRYTLLLGFIAIMAFGDVLNAATLEVCQGTNTSQYIPMWLYRFDDYWQKQQMIYPSSLLTQMQGNQITSLTFYATGTIGSVSGGEIEVSLGTTSSTTFGSAALITTGLTKKATFAMNSTVISGSQLTITLDSPYEYNGGNLVIEFNKTTNGSGYQNQTFAFYGVSQSGYTSIYQYKSSENGSFNTPTRLQFLPRVTFGYEESQPRIEADPSAVTFETEPGTSQTLDVAVTGENLTGNITATLNDANGVYSFSSNSLTTTTSLSGNGGTLSITYSPNAEGTHAATITLTNADAASVTITLNGTCRIKTDAIICEGNGTQPNQFLPVYGWYFDANQINQMLYPAAKLENTGMNGKKITKITFYPTTYSNYSGINFHSANGGSSYVKIELANMPSGTTGYASSTSLKAANFVEVKTITMPTNSQSGLTEWVFNDLDNVFIYEGGDLLVQVTTSEGVAGYTYFAGENLGSNNYMSCYSYSGSYNRDPTGQTFLPKVKFDFEDSTPVTDGTVSPTTVDFGAKNIGGTYTATVTVTNTGNQPFTPVIDVTGLSAGISVSPTTSGQLAAHGTLDLTVTFTPTAETSYSGSFTVTIPVPDGEDLEFTVTVTGSGYYANKLKSNTVEVPVYKSEAKAPNATYVFLKDDVEDDIDMSLSYGKDANVKVDVLVKDDEPITGYDLLHQEGSGNWESAAAATQDANNPKSYVYNDETFVIPSDATEMWLTMTDEDANASSTIYYVPVTVANGIVTQGNTYGAPQVQAEKDNNISFNITISGHKSDQRPGGHWMQKVMVDGQETEVDYCVYTLVINIHDVNPAFDETRKPYKLRAWLLKNENIPYFDFDRVPNENDPNHSHIEGSAEPLTCPKLLGECTDFSGTSYYIGDDYIAPAQNQGADPNPWGSVKLQNAFAAPSNMDQTGIEVAVRAYYYKEDEVNPSLMLLNRDGDAPADGYGMGEGEGHAQSGSIVTAVNELSIDRQVVDVKYVNVQGMQSDRPFDGLNIVVTRYSDGSTTATKVVR